MSQDVSLDEEYSSIERTNDLMLTQHIRTLYREIYHPILVKISGHLPVFLTRVVH